MALLAGKNYDPGTAVSKALTSNLALTAVDTTNLRNTFTAPANGCVLVRLCGVVVGGSATSQILLGVLSGATIMGRTSPMCGKAGTTTTSKFAHQSEFVVSGLTPAQSYSFDAAYGVETAVASNNLKYGGPDDSTTNNAWGGFQFEVWETPNLLGAILYDPTSAVQKATSSLIAMTALDTTNLRITFTAPTSGNVFVSMMGVCEGATTMAQIQFGVLDGATVRCRTTPVGGGRDVSTAIATTGHVPLRGGSVVTGLTPGNSYTWDAAYSVDVVVASTNLNYGGPDDTTSDNAWGGFAYSIWAA